jgi:hypothetical protein
MSKPAFTPGPWSYDPLDAVGMIYSITAEQLVARIPIENNPACKDAWPADARIIAAAPDLYEALDQSLGYLHFLLEAIGREDPQIELLGRVRDIQEIVRAAMKKADGRS